MIRILRSGVDDVIGILRQRTIASDEQTESIVRQIIKDVQHRGDAALLDCARRFDSPDIKSIHVSSDELESASRQVPDNLKQAILTSYNRVLDFHTEEAKRIREGWTMSGDIARWKTEQGDGAFLGQMLRPLRSAGVYVPGGRATYVSSVIMNAVPAKASGVKRIVITTPCRKDGNLDPAVLFASQIKGLACQVVKVGGAAAVAALAFGTESIERVDKVVGPGNKFVNEAKRQLWGRVGLDGYAGPSEVCVLADDHANVSFAAADFLTQIEHAPDNAGFLVTISEATCQAILAEIDRQATGTIHEETMRRAMAEQSLAIVAKDLLEAIDIVNQIAPEHLTLAIQDPETQVEKIVNAGCVLLGEWTPESAGDFCLGPSHTLPTSGAARWQSPLNVLDFIKVQSTSYMTLSTIKPLIEIVEAFGELEGFPTHGFGATARRR